MSYKAILRQIVYGKIRVKFYHKITHLVHNFTYIILLVHKNKTTYIVYQQARLERKMKGRIKIELSDNLKLHTQKRCVDNPGAYACSNLGGCD